VAESVTHVAGLKCYPCPWTNLLPMSPAAQRPGFVWSADGDIVHVLRARHGGSVLARPLENFSLENVTPMEGLHQLCEALQTDSLSPPRH